MEDYKIEINTSLNAVEYKDTSNLLQQEAFSSLKKLLEEHHSKIKAQKDGKLTEVRSHSSIFISAPRGSGKTTFLLNIRKYIDAIEDPFRPSMLKIIYPTLLFDSDNFISIVISRIAEKVNEYNRNSTEKRSQFLRKLSEVAEMIKAISDSKTSVGIENIIDEQNALRLESEIHNFLRLATEILDCSYLILPIDDIDMSFKHGFDVLDLIRQYFASPFIVPVISGDLSMYQQIFAMEFFRQMTNNKGIDVKSFEAWQKNEKSDNNNAFNFVNKSYDLADRYLEKVLPKNKRIRLINVYDIIKINPKIGNNRKLKSEIENITNSFNTGCGTAIFECENSSLEKIDPIPYHNLREFLQFFAAIDVCYQNDSNKLDFLKLNKEIRNFYEFANPSQKEKIIYDFAYANFEATYESRNFSVKKFSQVKEMEKYFHFGSNSNALIVPYYPASNSFKAISTPLDRLFYIISFEAEIDNGARIYISPDKFFLWFSAKLFSNEDISKKCVENERYNFGFDNKILLNDLLNKSKETLDTETDEIASGYEKIKYGDKNNVVTQAMLDIRIEELEQIKQLKHIKCSAILLYNMYAKFRKNVNSLNNANKDKTISFGEYVKRLIIIYFNALAISSIKDNKYSKNDICINISDIDELRTKDLAYKWNINRWSNDDVVENNIGSKTDTVPEFGVIEDALLNVLSFLKLNDNSKKSTTTISETEKGYYAQRNIKFDHEKSKTPKRIQAPKSNFTKFLNELKVKDFDLNSLISKIKTSQEYKDIKDLPKDEWFERLKKKQPNIYNGLFQ